MPKVVTVLLIVLFAAVVVAVASPLLDQFEQSQRTQYGQQP